MEKKKLSITCVLGFAVPVLAPVTAFFLAVNNVQWYKYFMTFLGLSGLSVFAGLVLSIAGTVSAKRSGKGGRGLGIAGIVISLLEMIGVILFIICLIWLGTGVQMSN